MAVFSPIGQQKNLNRLNNNRILVLRLVPYLRRHIYLLSLAMGLLIPLATAGAIQPLIIGQAVSLLRQESAWRFLRTLSIEQGIIWLSILLSITVIIRVCCASFQGYLVQKIGQIITADIRKDLFTHVTSLEMSFFNRTPVGRLVTRLTSDVEALGDVFSSGAIGVLSDGVYIFVIIITMITVQVKLALMLVLMMIPVTGLIIYFQSQYRKANYKVREELSKLNSILQENIAGIDVVQLFRRELFNSELFRSANERYRKAVDKTIFYDSAVSATSEWISLVAIAGVLWLGGVFIVDEVITFGTLSAFILYAQRLFNPLRQLVDKLTIFQAGFTAIERISELMNEPIEIIELEDKIHSLSSFHQRSTSGEICFENVWFGYNKDEYVLKNLDFTIHAGEKIAFVGPTGAGKSSIIRLLCRLYDPIQGRILIDGVDLREISKTELRQYIGVILQESFLFAGDVMRNIVLGEDYCFEQVQKAANITNIEQFINELPQGYKTQVRERGANLSGGQKQLLAFARVAIRNPRILVLDEATSSLDVKTEALIQDALDHLLNQRTAVIIAHRLSTIRDVNRIFVLKKGELLESGNHQELLKKGGLYNDLYKLQMMKDKNS
ncbi:MAG: ABC transporter ATP-binding protein [cyanobacterium endosymbiont of Rhopalodia musculus]|uniref:ABC transporter ATP-binding protein n=1 Tax=cyanobacterium endosymbiont of Epithemia clementina EcSB TaxID=3034674 RepID=UPI0024818772|nr:ABC transporter ATP-binding protein [cyanobacterium endosymbiont of Epithemia clementina EcSB]WGT67154.1 ABC transporter ATP-binding protein [cyanobacterium endosymbiont of Epithemia clementina EcSB]